MIKFDCHLIGLDVLPFHNYSNVMRASIGSAATILHIPVCLSRLSRHGLTASTIRFTYHDALGQKIQYRVSQNTYKSVYVQGLALYIDHDILYALTTWYYAVDNCRLVHAICIFFGTGKVHA